MNLVTAMHQTLAKIIACILFSFLCTCANFANAQQADVNLPVGSTSAWNNLYPFIESQISEPVFNSRKLTITQFGAKSNNPRFLNTKAINKAIAKCSTLGGGTVVVPAGVWHTGPITLKSNVNLYLSDGSTLLFTDDLKQYPLVITRWEGIDCYNYQPMIYAYGETNIAVTGKGTIDGGANNDNWWRMCGAAHFGWKEGVVSQRIGRPLLLKYNEEGTPVENRRMGDGYGMRTQLVNFYKCKNVLMDGVKLLRSPFWVIHPLLSENLIFRNLHIENDGPNGDGCDPESCKNVLIEGCFFDTGDDCIAIKSGRNGDGRRWGIPSENIIVRNCKMKNGHGGVVVGSEISGGYRNLFVENCDMDSPELDRVIRVKTSTCRGGLIENIFVRNVTVGVCKECVLRVEMTYEAKEICNRGFSPVVRNIYLDNITSRKSKYGVFISALEDYDNVYNINVSNSKFDGVEMGNLITGKASDLNFSNLYLNGQLLKTNQPLSKSVVYSQMKRFPEAWMLDNSKKINWGYTQGLETESFFQVYEKYRDSKIWDYVMAYTDSIVNEDGSINSYHLEEYNIDQINSGKLLFKVYDATHNEKYLKAIHLLFSQMKNHPRTSEGGFWHKKIYPNQMWLDGLYMGTPFMAQYAQRVASDKNAIYDDITSQFRVVAKHTFDPVTGLYRHGWDESKTQPWANPLTGQSAHAWGRAQGWFFMALIDALDYFPQDYAKRSELLTLLKSIADGVLKFQDEKTGLWYQVLDQPGREGNYLEATCSSMFCYSLLKGVRKGYLDGTYKVAALKAYNGIRKEFLVENPDGTLSLTRCCQVAGLGGANKRDGSFKYYIGEKINDNDPKGTGPFIKACLEIE
jgi:unsaturated rhamnogalacturonyl hydrolase